MNHGHNCSLLGGTTILSSMGFRTWECFCVRFGQIEVVLKILKKLSMSFHKFTVISPLKFHFSFSCLHWFIRLKLIISSMNLITWFCNSFKPFARYNIYKVISSAIQKFPGDPCQPPPPKKKGEVKTLGHYLTSYPTEIGSYILLVYNTQGNKINSVVSDY